MDDSDGAREETPEDRGTDDPITDSVEDAAQQRQHERTEGVEGTLAEVREDLGNRKYPVSSEELSAAYADEPIDLPNETESLGSVFRRLDETFEDEEAAYDAVITELDDEELAARSDGPGTETATWSEERAETQHEFEDDPIPDEDYESSVERSRERAREAQAESNDGSDDDR